MKMIWAVIRPEFTQQVIEGLDYAGVSAITRLPVNDSDASRSPFLLPAFDKSQEMLMIAVPDNEVAKTVTVIRSNARSNGADNSRSEMSGGGKIFVTYIDESFTIRTAGKATKESGV
jgi:nitrogen regulatory protein PII 1